jgi:Rrf2 family transcriptional regulator, nitric oxide-sensitive transcriptional repressor
VTRLDSKFPYRVPDPGGTRLECDVFSQTTEYALRAMACLATAPGELVPTTTLASKTNVPANYLAKVLQQLASSGMIKGRRGVGGGYMLARDAGDITLLEIVQTVGELNEREERSQECRENTGSLNNTLERVKSMVTDTLNSVTLDSLVQSKPSRHRAER